MSGIFDSLNPEQRRAAMQAEGPVLILAGAGSGKTRVITHRIAYLMQECGVSPYNILAITFTNKAAGEMRRRVDDLIGFGAESVWISTFHALCVRILRRFIDRIGYEKSFSIYDTDDQKRIMKDICKKLKIDPKFLREKTILSSISSAKNAMIGPSRFRSENADKDYIMERIADCYDEYQAALRRNNALDFDDLLLLTVQLFQNDRDVLEQYRNRFRYIMVDEYQDTNKVQFELVRLLSEEHRNLCVVGDDDQSIYKFRGADIRNILDFEKVFPDALVVRLEQNYRSSQTILDAANAVIRNNRQRKDKKLWSEKGRGAAIRFRHFNTPQEEAAFIVSDILQKKKGRGVHSRDFAVLYRTNAQSRALEEQFVRSSLPYNVVGGTNFYDRKEIRDILAYLKTIENGRDEIAVKRILNVPRRGIGGTTIDRIDAFAVRKRISFAEAVGQSRDIPQIGRALSKLEDFTALINRCREYAESHLPSELIGYIIEQTGYEDELYKTDADDAEDRMNNLKELVSKAVEYQETAQEPTLAGFLEDVALVADIDSVGEEDDRVLLMTLHSAKGLEFPHVYIAGMENGLFPSEMSMESDDLFALEEERRLAYVGITRAKETLTLTACRQRMQWGNISYNRVSQFVSEIPDQLFDSLPSYKKSYDYYEDDSWDEVDAIFTKPADPAPVRSRPKAVYVKPHTAEEKKPFIARTGGGKSASISSLKGLQKGMPVSSKPDYGVGDRVRHIKFGDGTVRELEPGPRDYKVTVEFDDCGQKVMYAGFAKLKKL